MKRTHTFTEDKTTQKQQLDGTNRLTQERNRYYLVNVILLVVVALLVLAVLVLSKLQTVIPVIAVIDANGHVVNQQVVDSETISGLDSFVQNQAYDFVTACNSFDPDFRQHYADLCHIRSTQDVASLYDAETAPENTNNPYYVIGKNAKRYPKITSITKIADHTYQIAFQSITAKQGVEVKTEYYTAIIHYMITSKPIAIENRWENPLGFVVTSYRKDQELDSHLLNKQ